MGSEADFHDDNDEQDPLIELSTPFMSHSPSGTAKAKSGFFLTYAQLLCLGISILILNTAPLTGVWLLKGRLQDTRCSLEVSYWCKCYELVRAD